MELTQMTLPLVLALFNWISRILLLTVVLQFTVTTISTRVDTMVQHWEIILQSKMQEINQKSTSKAFSYTVLKKPKNVKDFCLSMCLIVAIVLFQFQVKTKMWILQNNICIFMSFMQKIKQELQCLKMLAFYQAAMDSVVAIGIQRWDLN